MNQLTNKMTEDTHSREVASGSLWTGEIFGHFFKGVFYGKANERR